MSLRDEARTAWLEEAGPGPFTRGEVEAAADCASRHWEPLLRAAYDLLYESYSIIDANPDEAKPGTVYAKIKEALG